VPFLIVVVLTLSTARVIQEIQDAREPVSALDVQVIGHQWWWEFRYPKLGIVTANELYVPVSQGRGEFGVKSKHSILLKNPPYFLNRLRVAGAGRTRSKRNSPRPRSCHCTDSPATISKAAANGSGMLT
jgi:hypothetical protein